MNSYLKSISDIENYKEATAYTSLLNYFKAINFAFPTCTIRDYNFYRVRLHRNKEEFFWNESELSYISDISKVKDFGRCNEPFQSMFYCSDNYELSLKEVTKGISADTLKEYKYHTISSWKLNEEISVAFFLEDNFDLKFNQNMFDMRQSFDRIIDDPQLIGDKLELKQFLLEVYSQFKRPFSLNAKAYYLSAAFANYLFSTTDINNKRVDGFIYPTCLDEKESVLGLNYVFRPDIIGKAKKIELVNAWRVNINDKNDEISCRGVEKTTGELLW
jgi:hypothetical protein